MDYEKWMAKIEAWLITAAIACVILTLLGLIF